MGTKKSIYYQKLPADMKIRYDEKILKCCGIDPYTLKEKELSNEKNDLPEISLVDIANHMIHSVSPFTKKQFKNYKGMEAYSFFESGFVLNIGSKKLDNAAILRGRVNHSMKMNETAHKVWVLAKMDGEIICGHCTCLAGLSETCSHVGAICYAVLNIAESTETTTSVTDILCKWNVPKLKEASMSRVTEINWRPTSYKRPTTSSQNSDESFLFYLNSLQKFSDEAIINFINDVHSDGKEPALRTILFPEEKRRHSKIKDEIFLSNLYSKNYLNKSRPELVRIAKSIKLEISEEDIAEITRVTISQQKPNFRVALKRGRITGSNIKDCCVSNIENPSITTISRVINPLTSFSHIPGVKYSIKNKKKAIKQYQTEAIENHENFEYQACGLIFNQKMPFFADSSDGLVYCDCHGRGCLKIKCLKILETQSFDTLTQKPNNILNKFGEKYHLEYTHEFFYQAQMNIHLSETTYCDVVFWSSITEPLVIRIKHDVEFWKMVSSKALIFHEEVIMPELLGKLFTKRKESSQDMDYNDEEYFDQTYEDLYDEYYELIDLEIEILNSED